MPNYYINICEWKDRGNWGWLYSIVSVVPVEGSPRENKLVQNALIGQQDISKFYKDTTTKQIFSKVSKLCEIGQYL